MTHAPRLAATTLCTVVLLAAATLTPRAGWTAGPDEGPPIRALLERAGLLADPLDATAPATALGGLRVTHRLHAGEPQLRIEYGRAGTDGRPVSATVTVQRWVTGTLEIRHADEHGRDQVVSKAVHDSCARQVTLQRLTEPGDPPGGRWRVAGVSALVRLTPRGHAGLPLVGLDTHAVSGGFLSVLSDVEELAVLPQTCAVTLPGDSVRVFVGGLTPDDAVCVFAGGQRLAAVRSDGSHAEATVALAGPAGLRQIGVTVFPRRTLLDAAAPADTRTWVLPILVGTPPPPGQEYFAL